MLKTQHRNLAQKNSQCIKGSHTMIDPYLINLTQEHDDEYLQNQFALYSLSIQTTHNTYDSHVDNLQPKIEHEEILKICMNTLHLEYLQ